VSSSVKVEAQAEDINVTSSQVAGQIDPRQMRDVPLNGRNWLELGLLVPGVTKNAINQGDSPLSGGDNGKYQINLDGQQVTQDTAGTNRTFLATVKTYNNPVYNTPAPYAPGYLITSRNQLYGQPISRLDARLSKTFTVPERFRLVALAEAFNLLNRANFGSYGTVITSSNFGSPAQNLNLAYGPRTLQLAGRFEF